MKTIVFSHDYIGFKFKTHFNYQNCFAISCAEPALLLSSFLLACVFLVLYKWIHTAIDWIFSYIFPKIERKCVFRIETKYKKWFNLQNTFRFNLFLKRLNLLGRVSPHLYAFQPLYAFCATVGSLDFLFSKICVRNSLSNDFSRSRSNFCE